MSLSRHPARPEKGADASCPCGSGSSYEQCCGRWHSGPQHLQAPTPEALMRSRYTAFVQQRWDYLLGTWHPSTRPTAPLESEPGVRWLGLEVRSRTVPSGEPLQGWVEFVARSKWGGRAQRLHERSRFLWEVGQWWYVDGQIR